MTAGRLFVARHGETVFNAAGRMQGATAHTPLTRAGFAQAEAMGEALRRRLGARPVLELWSSPAGRALQTLAVIAEHLELDWHEARTDVRLAEIDVGEWTGRYHAEIAAERGAVLDRASGLFTCVPPGGEGYDQVAARLRSWLDGLEGAATDRLVVMHQMSSRVLRGLLTGGGRTLSCGTTVADRVAQGALVEISGGAETVIEP